MTSLPVCQPGKEERDYLNGEHLDCVYKGNEDSLYILIH